MLSLNRQRLALLAASLASLAACGNGSRPTISSFAATPSELTAGQSAVLSWSVKGATALRIDPDIGAVTGTSLDVSPAATTTYTLTATNAAGNATRQVTVTVAAAGAPSIASFTADPATIAAGASTTLSWSVTGATAISIDPDIGALTGTSRTVSPAATTLYTLTATNAAGSATRQVTVTVAAAGAPSIASFTADPATIAAEDTSTLSWSVSGATSLQIDPDVGAVTGTSRTVSPAATTTYTLTATNAAGSATRQVTVTVAAAGAPSIASFTADPTTIAVDDVSTLSWTVSGATSLRIDPDVGAVTGADIDVSPSATTTYTLTATNDSGSSTRQVTVAVAGSVPAIASFTASSGTIAEGASATLSWSVTGATSISISPNVGAVSGTSCSVSPTATTSYTLTATNAAGSTTQQVTVTVSAASGPPVIASFTADPATISLGQSSTLSWSVTGATSIWIAQTIGAVTGTSRAVSPTATTTYTLWAYNSLGMVSQAVTVSVAIAPTPRLVTSGNKIYFVNSETAWTGRGVNIDDLSLSYYYNYSEPAAEEELKAIVAGLISNWKPNFIRVALNMNSMGASWLTNPDQYRTPMMNVINGIGAHLGVYALVTLQSDSTMDGCDTDDVCVPSSSTDDVYRALVDSFKDAPFVLFGVSNEPGGMSLSDEQISSAMSHAVDVIRAREDELDVPHHLVAVQGNNWSSKLDFYDQAPLQYDNVVYEYHSFPPQSSGAEGYTYLSIPVIIGKYGPPLTSDLPGAAAFFADVEAKSIPTLAWILSPYNGGAPNLTAYTRTSSSLMPTVWGERVQSYLLDHAQ